MSIQLLNQENIPKIICPHCKSVIPINLREWENDCTRIVSDRCPKCNGDAYFGILILASKTLPRLASTIQGILSAIGGENQIIGGKKKGG